MQLDDHFSADELAWFRKPIRDVNNRTSTAGHTTIVTCCSLLRLDR